MANSFVMYKSFWDSIKLIKDPAKRCAYYDALMAKGFNDEMPDDEAIAVAISQMGIGIENAQVRYEKAKENGSKGGRKSKYDKDLVIKLFQEGYSPKQIEEQDVCPERTAQRYIKEFKASQVEVEKVDFEDVQEGVLDIEMENDLAVPGSWKF